MPRRVLLISPVLASAFLWALASALLLLHVLRADDFVMAEVRRHGLVPDLVTTLLWFSLPYLVIGAACAWSARGLVRLIGARAVIQPLPAGLYPGRARSFVRRRAVRLLSPPGALEAILGNLILTAVFACSTALGMVERPSLFAGLFYLRSGRLRSLQLGMERWMPPDRLRPGAALLLGVLGVCAAFGWWKHSRVWLRRGGLVLALAALGLLWMLRERGSAPATATVPDAGRPNVLLVVVDSLRPDLSEMMRRSDGAPMDTPLADAVAALRAAEPIHPELDRFAAEAVRLTSATTPLARTTSSLATLLSGRHPLRHGIRTEFPEADVRSLIGPTLPRSLAAAGWTPIVVGGYCAAPIWGMRSGFVVERIPRSDAELIPSFAALRGHPLMPVWLRAPWARQIWPQVRSAVEGSHPQDVAEEAIAAWRRSTSPFFVLVFFDNPHLPYVPAWPDSASAGAYSGPNRYSLTAANLVEQIRQGEEAPQLRGGGEEIANARRLYAAAVRSVDRALGRLLLALEADGLSRDTLVTVLADHGENLMDAGGPLAHGEAMERDRSTSVPWLMRWPGRLAPGAIGDRVSLIDFAPTLLDLLGLPAPPGLDGTSLAQRLTGGPSIPDRPMLFETGLWFFSRDMVDHLDAGGRGLTYPSLDEGLITVEPGRPPQIVVAPQHRDAVLRAKHRRLEFGPWALTYRPRPDGARFRLFRSDRDPWLTRDLSAAEPARLQEMIRLFYAESERLEDRHVSPPRSETDGGEGTRPVTGSEP